jgi:addiction module HigA family antidote
MREHYDFSESWRNPYIKIKPVHPGELLHKEFLEPMGISPNRLAKEIDVPPQRIGEIVARKRSITEEIDLSLCKFFGLSSGYWLRAQAAYDAEAAKKDSPLDVGGVDANLSREEIIDIIKEAREREGFREPPPSG